MLSSLLVSEPVLNDWDAVITASPFHRCELQGGRGGEVEIGTV